MSHQSNYESATFREYSRKLEEMDIERDEDGMEEADYPVKCVCGYFGMRFDCRRGECPNCGLRTTREY